MAFCTHCGREAAPADKFCLNCGQTLVSPAQVPGGLSGAGAEVALTTPLNHCPECGKSVGAGEDFCTNCGFDIRSRSQIEIGHSITSTSEIRGLGRNSLVYLTREGLRGFRLQSDFTLTLALLLPFPFIALSYYFIHAGTLVVYLAIWIAAAGLLYDELKMRGVRRLLGHPLDEIQTKAQSWLVPWHSIRMADWNGMTLWFSSADPAIKGSATFDAGDSQSVEGTLSSRGIRYSLRRPRLPPKLTQFWTVVVLFFVAAQVILIVAATVPFFPGEQQMYNTILNNTRSQVTNVSALQEFRVIYVNNIQVAWGGAVPFLGALSFAIASYNTGRVIQVIALGGHMQSSIVVIALYILPHTWVEEFSYPLATIAGIFSVTKWRSVSPTEFSRRLNLGSTKLVLALGGAALTLLLAATLEVLATYIGLLAILLWVPIVFLLYFLVRWTRKHSPSAMKIGRP